MRKDQDPDNPDVRLGRWYPKEKVMDKECILCNGTKEVIKRPVRLMGATYPEEDIWKGDEHFEPCPLCLKKKEL